MNESMKKFLEENHQGREIQIFIHCHRFKVNLIDEHRDISTGIDITVESAFNGALKNFKRNLKHIEEYDRKHTENIIIYHKQEIKRLKKII